MAQASGNLRRLAIVTMVRKNLGFRLWLAAIAFGLGEWLPLVGQESESTRVDPQAGEEKAEKPERKNSNRRVRVSELSNEERVRYQRQMGDVDLYSKDGVAFRKTWGFKSGVTELYPPFYDGWVDGKRVKGLYEEFVQDGEPGYTLASVSFNQPFYQATGKEFINFFALVWVPEQFAFTLFQTSNFEALKEGVRDRIVEARKQYANRDQFDSFEDYVAFKFGRDEDMENFVDGYWIEANEGPEHLTYFYTSEFLVERRKQAFKRPLIATTTYLIVRNKLLKIEIAKEYSIPEDIAQLLEFTNGFREDMKVVNRYGETDR